MKKMILATMIVSTVFVSACATQKDNETLGAAVGGVVGGVLGSRFGDGTGQVLASFGGALIGTWVGTHVARSLSMEDKEYYEKAEEEAHNAPVGEEIVWNNPETGAGGTITPVRAGRTNNGEYCREYQQTITIDGQTERAYGTACQKPDGSWEIVN